MSEPHDLDRQLALGIARATSRGRAVLCTLARLGKAMQQSEPARAGVLLAASQASPLYTGARLLFDLLELDDLLLNGAPPAVLAGGDLQAAFAELAVAFTAFVRALEKVPLEEAEPAEPSEPSMPAEPAEPAGAVEGETVAAPSEPAPVEVRELPEIDSSDYLFDLVVLGVLQMMSGASTAEARRASAEGGPAPERGAAGRP